MPALWEILKPERYNKAYYLNTLKMLFALFSAARKGGDQALEAEIEDPSRSASFASFPAFQKDHHAVHYVCDTLQMSLMGGSPFDLDAMMELDADTHHHEEAEPVGALQSTADALPGLGIVAAVLGVVVTMGSLGGPPEEIGHKVAAALVGTFLGILLCYGLARAATESVRLQGSDSLTAQSRRYRRLSSSRASTICGNARSASLNSAVCTHRRAPRCSTGCRRWSIS